MSAKISVILDTDIGSDIDDTWALATLLKSPEVDLKMVVSCTGDTTYRARIVAKFLERAGRTDIPVAVGTKQDDGTTYSLNQVAWIDGYTLAQYPGQVYQDGVQAMVDFLVAATEPITVLGIGPLPNVYEALRREPRIVEKARFVGMHGSVYKGYDGSDTPQPEYNVVKYPAACREVFCASWSKTITPLDTCGVVRLRAEKYAAVCNSSDPIAQAVIENYRVWRTALGISDYETESSILFDTVAAYLCFSEELLKMETVKLTVMEDGRTLPDSKGYPVRCALEWKDLPAYEDWLVNRLIG